VTLVVAAATALLGGAGAAVASGGSGLVRGGIYCQGGSTPKVKVLVFDEAWHYLRSQTFADGIYKISQAPGSYYLQFVDQRPAYDTAKCATTDVRVTVRAGHTLQRTASMRRGAAIVGTLRAGKSAAGWSTVVAVNGDGQSYPTKANAKGQFAVAGLPAGNYSVYGYDRHKKWVGPSTWVPKLTLGKVVDRRIAMKKPAGRLLIDLYAGDAPIRKQVSVTVVNRTTGQFWSARSAHGSVTFAGLYPGRYRISMPGTDDYLGRDGNVSGGKVVAGRVSFGSFRLTERGGTVSGTVVDSALDPATGANYPLRPVRVVVHDRYGATVASTTTDASGRFTVGGQLITAQSPLTLRLEPSPDAGGWMQAASYCRYDATALDVAVTTGGDTSLGPITLARTAGAQNPPGCQPGPATTSPAAS